MTAGDGPDREQRELAARLREARAYLGLSQQYVTAATGIARSAISEIERGNRKVDSLELRKLAKVYGYSVAYFLGVEADQVDTTSALGRVLTDLTDDDHDEVLRFAEFLSYQRRTRES